MEQQTETAPIDEKRQRLLASLEKARAARAANIKARAEMGPLLGKSHAPAKAKSRRKTARAIEQKKPARKDLPDDWLAGIHHAPNGCPAACNAMRCVITGENVCAHPDTNLQAKYLAGGHPEVVDRFNAARLELKRLDAEKSLKK
jgi:hypothetical protein